MKPFKFKKGDVIRMLDDAPPEGKTKDDWAVGICERTKAKGPFPLDCVYAIPCVERPPEEFLVRSVFFLRNDQYLIDGHATKDKGRVVGICKRTKAKGPFPLDCVYAIPCVERPPEEFLVSRNCYLL